MSQKEDMYQAWDELISDEMVWEESDDEEISIGDAKTVEDLYKNKEFMELVENMDKMEPQEFQNKMDKLPGDKVRFFDDLDSETMSEGTYSEAYKIGIHNKISAYFGKELADRIMREREERIALKEKERQINREG